MFSLREFIKNGFKDAVGKMADYQIILNASGYYEKGVLLEEDLAELQELINAKNTVEDTTAGTEKTEEVQDTEVVEGVENVNNTEDSAESVVE